MITNYNQKQFVFMFLQFHDIHYLKNKKYFFKKKKEIKEKNLKYANYLNL